MTAMTFSKSSFLLLTTLFFQGFLSAQEWTSYQSANQVNDLVDTGTELLLATDNGLIVVDKSTLERTIFTKDNSSLSNNHIQSITRGQNGSVWIGTYDIVLSTFDGSDFQNSTSLDESIVLPNTEMYDLKVAPNGDLWVGTTKGLFHRTGESWSRYAEAEFGPDYFETWDVEVMDNGDVFAAGIDLHQLMDGQWVNLTEGTQLSGYRSADLFTSSAGDLYLAGDLEQIGRYDGENWQEYDIDFNGSEVIQFTEDTDGNVYFSTIKNGIFKLENDSWLLQSDLQTEAVNNNMAYFHIDEQNNRWLNTNIHLSVNESGNIRSTLITDNTLESNSIQDVHKGANGKMYFITGSQENFSVLDMEGNWSFLPKPPTAMPFELMYDILVLADDNIWLASQRGIYQYDGNEWAFTNLDPCYKLDIDSQGKLYAMSIDKIYLIDNGMLSEFNTTNSALSPNNVVGLGVDSDDNLWISTGDFELPNVVQTVTPEGTWTTYTATDHPVIGRLGRDFHFDKEGNVWAVNHPSGALKFDGTSWTNPLQENRDEITNIAVHTIKSDEEGKVYFAHEYGITTLLDGEWENFINEEVTTNNTQDTSIDFDPQGTLWWGNARTGLFSFMPEPTTSSSSPFEIVADFKVFPNPAQTYTTVDFTTQQNANVAVAIYNQIGQLASTINLGQFSEGTYQREINLDRLAAGFYTLQLRNNKSISTRKLIID